jgi:hypothetical protein
MARCYQRGLKPFKNNQTHCSIDPLLGCALPMPASAVGAFTATMSPPRALHVDLLIRRHCFLLASL